MGRSSFGSVRRFPSGRYQTAYWHEGVRHVGPQMFATKADADAYLATVRADLQRGVWTDPTGAEVAFLPYAEKWIASRLVKGHPLTPATRQGYRALLRRNLEPTLARAQLGKITPERVREWHSTVVRTAGADQAAKSYRLLRAILNTAVDDRLIARNPCVVRGAGVEKAPERPAVETSTVLDLADAIAPRLRAFVFLAGFGTLRTGESLGLERRDIDPLRGVVHVRREAQEIAHVRDERGEIVEEHGRVVTDPKSEAGKRTVALPRFVMDELERHLAEYVAPEPEALVFTRRTGSYLRRQDLSAAWRGVCDAVGVTPWSRDHPEGIRPHDLRHHAATTTARIPGVTTKELMARLGHASPRAALIYQHATEERDRTIADHLDTLIASTARDRAQVVGIDRARGAREAPSAGGE